MASSAPHNPPFRADHVGSLLRPPELLRARADQQAGKLSAERLHELEDKAIKDAVALQESVGLPVMTDGEFRRVAWFSGFYCDGLGIFYGRGKVEDGYFIDVSGDKIPLVLLQVQKSVKWTSPIHVRDFNFLKSISSRMPKITLPSPVYAHFRSGRAHISKQVYPDLEMFWDDIVDAFQKEIRALFDAGCRYVQLDDPPMAFLCDRDNVWPQMRHRGEDPEKLLFETYPNVINRCLEGRPAGMQISMHLCRGNGRGHWGASGGYDALADTLFNKINVDSYFLEYDSPRAGSFEPLRFVPKNKTVVLGLISTKVAALETKDSVKRRIDEASKFVDLDQLALSPQCGFGSAAEGNLISPEQEAAKLRMVVEIAKEVWG